jgi:hypothetical protein
MRCLYLARNGRQCPAQALEGQDFCEDHYLPADAEPIEEVTRTPYIYQFAAVLLLLIFFAEAYQMVRFWLNN